MAICILSLLSLMYATYQLIAVEWEVSYDKVPICFLYQACNRKSDAIMNVSENEFKFMVEGITSDLIQMLIDREHYSLPNAVEAVYNSNVYSALQRSSSNLYTQSSGYVFKYLKDELQQTPADCQ